MTVFIALTGDEAEKIEKDMKLLKFKTKRKGQVIVYKEPYFPSWTHKN